MPYKEKEIEKLFYSIGEISEMLDISASMIRFWEKEFNQLKPKKSLSGTRQYSKADIELIRRIHHLVKQKGFTLDGAKKALQNHDTRSELKLKESLETLENMKKSIELILEKGKRIDS